IACAVRVHGSGGHRRPLWPTAEMELFQPAPELTGGRGRCDPAVARVRAPAGWFQDWVCRRESAARASRVQRVDFDPEPTMISLQSQTLPPERIGSRSHDHISFETLADIFSWDSTRQVLLWLSSATNPK